MKARLLIAAPITVLVLAAWTSAAGDATRESIAEICGAEHRPLTTTGPTRLTIERGMGDGGFGIRTTSREAQAWFNYGIKLFHAFYHADAKAAFDKAVGADPDCAMCLWGQALSRGPTQNFDVNEGQTAAALVIAQKARAAARTPLEIALSDAMVARYTPPAPPNGAPEAKAPPAALGASGPKPEEAFSAAIIAAVRTEPKNIDLPLIASESLLTAWRRGDKDKADAALAIIEPILRAHPNNTAAIHYYIHATEFAGVPERALPYAKKLARLAPEASHLVHMGAHTFLRVGLYEDAAVVNAEAIKTDADHMIATNTPGPVSGAYYYGHNLRFGMSGALMSGDAALALKFADDVHAAYPTSAFDGDTMTAAQGQEFGSYARYAPDRMLALADPGDDRPTVRGLYHYGRGEAFAMKHDVAGLRREAALVGDKSAMAKAVIAGRLAMLEGRYDDAIKAFEPGVALEEGPLRSSNDPPPWWYPVRRSIAAAQLKAGRLSQAADEARKSLAFWPNDPLALLVLSQAEDGLGMKSEARGHRREAEKAWRGDLNVVSVDTI